MPGPAAEMSETLEKLEYERMSSRQTSPIRMHSTSKHTKCKSGSPLSGASIPFRAQPDAPVEELAKFLAARILRPVVGRYQEDAQFKVGAFHRRTLGGTNGMLEIGPESIQFVSDKPADSRTWLYRDIETIGRPDSFRFRVTTKRETYVFELKNELLEAAYQLAWSKVYNLQR